MHNNYNNNNSEATEKGALSPDELAPDAMPLCPKCLKAVDPKDYYCPHCGSDEPINPLSAYMPFVRLRYMYSVFGTMWRKLWNDDMGFFTSLLFILLIIVFAPILIVVGTPVMAMRIIKNRQLRTPHLIGLLIGLAVIAIILLLGWVMSI